MSSGTSVPPVHRCPTQRNVSTRRWYPFSIGPHAPNSVASSDLAQQSMYASGRPEPHRGEAARTWLRASAKLALFVIIAIRYVERYEQLRASGQTVIIDGLCASSCTIVLGAIPHERICVTRNANLAFHAAWDFGAHGRAITNPGATRMLYSMYPSQVRHWIANRGGLSPRMIFLRGCTAPVIWVPRLLHHSERLTSFEELPRPPVGFWKGPSSAESFNKGNKFRQGLSLHFCSGKRKQPTPESLL
jgi:hypothetical protein